MKKGIILFLAMFLPFISGCLKQKEYPGVIFINPLTGEGMYVKDSKVAWEMSYKERGVKK